MQTPSSCSTVERVSRGFGTLFAVIVCIPLVPLVLAIAIADRVRSMIR